MNDSIFKKKRFSSLTNHNKHSLWQCCTQIMLTSRARGKLYTKSYTSTIQTGAKYQDCTYRQPDLFDICQKGNPLAAKNMINATPSVPKYLSFFNIKMN
jgi:hypothetical protein